MILVVGATGLLGGLITRQLLAHGHIVRILIRKNSPSEQLVHQGMATPPPTPSLKLARSPSMAI